MPAPTAAVVPDPDADAAAFPEGTTLVVRLGAWVGVVAAPVAEALGEDGDAGAGLADGVDAAGADAADAGDDPAGACDDTGTTVPGAVVACDTGQTVVYKLLVSVVTEPVGQFLTVAGQLVIVYVKTV